MDRLTVSDLKGALLENEGSPTTMEGISSNKMNPLKTTKQRNTSNNHRKSQRSTASGGRNNSTDEDVRGDHHQSHAPLPIASVLLSGDEEGFRKCHHEGDGDNENTTNNDEQSGFVDDSENDNIADRLCSLSKLSLHSATLVVNEEEEATEGHFYGVGSGGVNNTVSSSSSTIVANSSIAASSAAFSPHSVSISKIRNPSYPSFHESDSISEAHLKNHFIPVQSSSGCHHTGATTTGDGDGASEAMDDCTGRRFRRRRRRRGHNTNTKRMAVEASVDCHLSGDETVAGYSILSAERPGPSHKKLTSKVDKSKTVLDPLDAFGVKRKRTIASSAGSASAQISDKKFGDMDIADVGRLSLNSPETTLEDQEMRSDDEDECSSCDSVDEEGDEDDRGREADDEQSDWVFDEWSTNSNKPKEETVSSRKKRLLKMLRSYEDMISANVAGGPLNSNYQINTREIRAGKRRVFVGKPGFPTKGIWTSANEEVSRFLQDPLQSQIRLKPISAEEGVKLANLASLYSLRMDYCNNQSEEQKMDDISIPSPEETVVDSTSLTKLIPVLTKTPNTTQMDKMHDSSSIVPSPFNAEGSSSSNVSSVYGPTHSDVDSSRTSDSKRIKK